MFPSTAHPVTPSQSCEQASAEGVEVALLGCSGTLVGGGSGGETGGGGCDVAGNVLTSLPAVVCVAVVDEVVVVIMVAGVKVVVCVAVVDEVVLLESPLVGSSLFQTKQKSISSSPPLSQSAGSNESHT